MRTYRSLGVRQQRQRAIKNTFPSFFPLLIVASLTNLAACLAVKRATQPRLVRALRHQLLLLCFFLLLRLGLFFFSRPLNVTAAEWTERPHCFT